MLDMALDGSAIFSGDRSQRYAVDYYVGFDVIEFIKV